MLPLLKYNVMKKTQVPDVFTFEVVETTTRLKEFKSEDLPLFFRDTEKYSSFTIYYKASIKDGRLHLEHIYYQSYEGKDNWSYGSSNIEDVFHDRCVSIDQETWGMAVDNLINSIMS
jgi:hypothetical protein